MLRMKQVSSRFMKKPEVLSKMLLNPNISRVTKIISPLNYLSTTSSRFQLPLQADSKSKKHAPAPGQEIHGFLVEEVAEIPDFQLTATRLNHIKSKAQYLHLDRNDTNNVFSANFRTIPMDSTGVPHILEHITLCGSDKFPIREVFFSMLTRSMATFLNAMTGPDYTMYPFATQNPKDFANLMSVYLDVVFKPKLRENDFCQEGWRLEHEDINDPKSPIIIRGVVYNEMKGVLSENNSIFSINLSNSILPSHTYRINSGGDPLVIPSLTYDGLKKFHSEFYHPTNSRIYSYGNFNLESHLKYLNNEYLDKYEKLPQSFLDKTKVPSEPRWDRPREKQIFGRDDPSTPEPLKQSSLTISQLCCDITDLDNTFILQILSELLMKGPNSAFYKSLVESNIGSGFHPCTGFDPYTKDTVLTVGLQGLNPDSFEKVIKLYDETVDEVINKGFDEKHLESILHNIELSLRHQSANFGLNLLFGLVPIWNHDGDIINALRVSDTIAHFKEELKKNPKLLQDKVKQYMKDNNHKLTLMMVPDKDYDEKLNKLEKEVIESKINLLTEEERKQIYQRGQDLRKYQETKEDISCLPSLKVSDINKTIEMTEVCSINHKSVPIQLSDQPTNGIIYFSGLLGIDTLTESEKLLLPLFCNIARRMGTSEHNYQEFDQLVRLKTGGISLSSHLKESITDTNSYDESVMISVHCLDQNVKGMFDVLSELLNKVTLKDLNRFQTLVKMIVGNMSHGIVDNGHLYAMSLAASQINNASLRNEELTGLNYINRMKKIVQDDLQPVLDQLSGISTKLFSKRNLKCAVNMTRESHSTALESTEEFINTLSSGSSLTASPKSLRSSPDHSASPGLHYVLPIPVNFASKSVDAVPYTHEDFPKLRILCNLLTMKYLLPTVREKGGAYGAGVKVSIAGTMNFYSYRDPNSVETLDAFDKSADWISNWHLTDRDIDEAKLAIFQKLDEPTPPSSKGMREFLQGVSDEMFQHHRTLILKVTKDDVKHVAEKYLSKQDRKCARSLIGPENTLLKSRQNESWSILEQQ